MSAILSQRSQPGSGQHQELLPPTRNRYRFLFQHHPFRWYFDESDFDAGRDGWLPSLGRITVTPGAGGVGDVNDTTLAMVSSQQRKWQVIPEEDARLGTYRFYTQRFPARGRAPVYGSIWDSVRG